MADNDVISPDDQKVVENTTILQEAIGYLGTPRTDNLPEDCRQALEKLAALLNDGKAPADQWHYDSAKGYTPELGKQLLERITEFKGGSDYDALVIASKIPDTPIGGGTAILRELLANKNSVPNPIKEDPHKLFDLLDKAPRIVAALNEVLPATSNSVKNVKSSPASASPDTTAATTPVSTATTAAPIEPPAETSKTQTSRTVSPPAAIFKVELGLQKLSQQFDGLKKEYLDGSSVTGGFAAQFLGGMKDISLPDVNPNGELDASEKQFLSYALLGIKTALGMESADGSFNPAVAAEIEKRLKDPKASESLLQLSAKAGLEKEQILELMETLKIVYAPGAKDAKGNDIFTPEDRDKAAKTTSWSVLNQLAGKFGMEQHLTALVGMLKGFLTQILTFLGLEPQKAAELTQKLFDYAVPGLDSQQPIPGGSTVPLELQVEVSKAGGRYTIKGPDTAGGGTLVSNVAGVEKMAEELRRRGASQDQIDAVARLPGGASTKMTISSAPATQPTAAAPPALSDQAKTLLAEIAAGPTVRQMMGPMDDKPYPYVHEFEAWHHYTAGLSPDQQGQPIVMRGIGTSQSYLRVPDGHGGQNFYPINEAQAQALLDAGVQELMLRQDRVGPLKVERLSESLPDRMEHRGFNVDSNGAYRGPREAFKAGDVKTLPYATRADVKSLKIPADMSADQNDPLRVAELHFARFGGTHFKGLLLTPLGNGAVMASYRVNGNPLYPAERTLEQAAPLEHRIFRPGDGSGVTLANAPQMLLGPEPKNAAQIAIAVPNRSGDGYLRETYTKYLEGRKTSGLTGAHRETLAQGGVATPSSSDDENKTGLQKTFAFNSSNSPAADPENTFTNPQDLTDRPANNLTSADRTI